jgi:transcriptional regulator
MHVPDVFAEGDSGRITAFVDHHPLATLVGLIDGRLQANHLPFMRSGNLAAGDSLISHVARANPAWQLGEANSEVLVVFTGSDAYVSPSFYPSKLEHHKVVPTYNYVAVHVRGRLSCSHDPAEKLRCVEMLTRRMESSRQSPWSVSDAPRDYIEQMLAGFVALSLSIDSIEAKTKASQNRSREDQAGVVLGLRSASAHSSALEAAAMIAERLAAKE